MSLSADAVVRAGDLRWMHTWSAGVDNLVPPGMDKPGITYPCGKGSGGVTMAEWALMLMLMWSKNAVHYLAAHEQRLWAPVDHGKLSGQRWLGASDWATQAPTWPANARHPT